MSTGRAGSSHLEPPFDAYLMEGVFGRAFQNAYLLARVEVGEADQTLHSMIQLN